MKKIRTDQTGGMPVTQYTIQKLQEAYTEIFTALVAYLGMNPTAGKYIVQGCEVSGGNISPGWFYLDGFILPFAGAAGDNNTKIGMSTTAESKSFFDTISKPLYYSYTAVVDAAGTKLSDFTRIPSVPVIDPRTVIDPAVGAVPAEPTIWERIEKLEKQNAVFQAGGGMVFWNKPAALIPPGWAEVVDWKGRIPVGMNSDKTGGVYNDADFSPLAGDTPGRQGGNRKVTLVEENIPKHRFTVPLPGNVGSAPGGGGIEFPGANNNVVEVNTNYYGGAADGSTTPISVLPPFRTVLFIEYVG